MRILAIPLRLLDSDDPCQKKQESFYQNPHFTKQAFRESPDTGEFKRRSARMRVRYFLPLCFDF